MAGFIRALVTIAGIVMLIGGVSSPPNAGASTDTAAVAAVESVAIVVEDMNRSLSFFTEVLPFGKVSDHEVTGGEFERLHGVFGRQAASIIS